MLIANREPQHFDSGDDVTLIEACVVYDRRANAIGWIICPDDSTAIGYPTATQKGSRPAPAAFAYIDDAREYVLLVAQLGADVEIHEQN